MGFLKRKITFVSLLMVTIHLFAQGPNNSGTYYRNADGSKGKALKTALYSIINSHTARSYDNLWTDFRTTDRRADGKVWDMYSNITNFTFGTDQAGSYSGEGDVYNREHSFPKSWFNDAKPMYTDLVHLVPTDGYVNGRRNNYPFGETNGDIWKSANGFSKLGSCTVSGYSGIVFEPNDEYKGDFARIYFYMATCYEKQISSWNSDMLSHDSYKPYATWAMDMLLRWAKEDPVSKKEIDRNNAIYSIQHNRNPFVDYPGLEEYVWGSLTSVAFSYDKYQMPDGGEIVDPDPNPDPDPDPQPGHAIFAKVTSTADLQTGVTYLIVCEEKSVAMTGQSSTVRSYESVTINGDKIETEVDTDGAPRQFVLGGSNGAYTFYDAIDKYLAYTSGNKNSLDSSETAEDNSAKWNISISGSGTVISNVASSSRNIQYNASSPRFACYTSAQKPVTLYKNTASTGVNNVTNTSDKHLVDVYSLIGVKVRKAVESSTALRGLGKGVYIVCGKKYVVR